MKSFEEAGISCSSSNSSARIFGGHNSMSLSARTLRIVQSHSTRITRASRLAADLRIDAATTLRRRLRRPAAFFGRLALFIAIPLGFSCGFAQAQNLVATVPAGNNPVAAAVNQTTNMIYVADSTATTLLAINGATNTGTTIQAGGPFSGVAVNATTNTVYALTNANPASVVVINGANNTVTTTIALTAAGGVIAVNSTTNQIYVGDGDNVSVIDGATNAIVTNISVPQAASSLAVDTATNVVWALYGVSGSDSTLAQINGATNAVTASVQVGKNDTSFALNATTNTLYVPDANGNQMYVINGATVAVTDTIPWPNVITDDELAVNPVTNTIYVNSCSGNVFVPCLLDQVSVLNGATNTVTTAVGVPSAGYLLVDSVHNQILLESSPVVIINGATNVETVVNDPGDDDGLFATGLAAGTVNTATNDFYLPAQGSVFVISGGAGPSGPVFSASPSPLAFGNQTQGKTSSAMTLTITNTGTTNLTITTVTPGGVNMADFIIGADSCSSSTVASKATCTVSVQFEPSTSSMESATLTFADNASDSPQTVTLTGTGVAPAATASTTVLTSSSPSVGAGASITFTATVTPASGTPTPTGTVTFKDGTTVLGTGTLNASGVATYTTSSLAVASHSITASYGGDSRNLASVSNTLTVTVSVDSTTTALTASASSITVGSSITFTATVTGTTGVPTPTGTVTFKDGTTVLGTGTLNASGVATYTTSSLAVASHSITASYGGDAKNPGSTSSTLTITVTLGSTTTALTASSSSIAVGASVTFTATVTGASGVPVPTGTVTFMNGATVLGTGTLNGSGVATYTAAALAAASYSVTAAYAGDSNNGPSTSSVTAVTVWPGPPSFSIAFSPSSGSFKGGTAAVTTITVTSVNGFASATTLSCGTLPKDTTCTFSSSSVTPAAAGTATSTLTIATDQKITTAAHSSGAPGSTPARVPFQRQVEIAGALAAFLLFPLLGARNRKLRRMLLAISSAVLFAVIASIGMTGCGGGPTTPDGTYPVVVTATSGALTQTATYSLTVQ
jgi:DNA-binding beta-propeller fold protein YncE